MKTKITPEGWMVCDSDSHLSKWIEESKRLDHDAFLIPLACSHIKAGDCVIDAGANLGSHTIAYSQAVGKDGTVIAVEPGKLAFECLLHNVGRFPLNNVMPLKAAISDLDGMTVSHAEDANLGASICTPVKKEDQIPGNSYLLTVTLDFIASQIQKPISFIKLDIEGWETDALIGASKILAHHRPTLLIEVNKSALELQGSSPGDLLTVLHQNKYNWTIAQPQCDSLSAQFDIIATPAEYQPAQ